MRMTIIPQGKSLAITSPLYRSKYVWWIFVTAVILTSNKELVMSGQRYRVLSCYSESKSSVFEILNCLCFFCLLRVCLLCVADVLIVSQHISYSKTAAILVSFCLLANQPFLPRLRENILLISSLKTRHKG